MRCRKHGNFALKSGDVIEFDDGLPVGGIGEFDLQDVGVVFGLLQPCGGRFVFGFCLDYGNGKVASVAQDAIGALAGTPSRCAAVNNDASVRESALLRY